MDCSLLRGVIWEQSLQSKETVSDGDPVPEPDFADGDHTLLYSPLVGQVVPCLVGIAARQVS